MIQSLTGTDLSSTKARSGLASLEELLPRLIRSYELQAQLVQRRQQQATPQPGSSIGTRQATFNWYRG